MSAGTMMKREESLESFKDMVADLLSMDVSDINAGIQLAQDAVSIIQAYATNATGWEEFLKAGEEILAKAGR